MSRRFWEDFETGNRGFTANDGVLPDGPLVEEITELDFYKREGICVCGKEAMDGVRCKFGASHARVRFFYHPESDCLFITNGEDGPSDGLVEEIDRETYERIRAQQKENEALS